MLFGIGKKLELPSEAEALPGRAESMPLAARNIVTGNPMGGPFPEHLSQCVFGMGCFWGVERLFWSQAGVYTTAAGYAAGHTKNPTYEEVCTGRTGHNEVVLVVYDPAIISFEQLLVLFWENHDPTQGMRQGPDRGTQYRSGIYTSTDEQLQKALDSQQLFQSALRAQGYGSVTTEIMAAPEFFYAEDYHQQYLHKNPGGYCSMRGTGANCQLPAGYSVSESIAGASNTPAGTDQ
ncbi:MAG: peptide-methionine (S)-S-oxide reductase MsrA [Granulosicoccus sp.]|nr:peptide-methionine (S)-S-oxide reductase MsrA [Granulosicoccus sp.]